MSRGAVRAAGTLAAGSGVGRGGGRAGPAGGRAARLIATLREELRLPVGAIQWYLAAVHGLALSVGAIVGALHTVAQRAEPVVASIAGGDPRQSRAACR